MKAAMIALATSLVACQAAVAEPGPAEQQVAPPTAEKNGKGPASMAAPPWADTSPGRRDLDDTVRVFASPENGMTGLPAETIVTLGWGGSAPIADEAITRALASITLVDENDHRVAAKVVHQPPSGPSGAQRVSVIPEAPLSPGWYTVAFVSDGTSTPSLGTSGKRHSTRFRVGSDPQVRQLRWCPARGTLDVFMSEAVDVTEVTSALADETPCKDVSPTAVAEKGATAKTTQFTYACSVPASSFKVTGAHGSFSRGPNDQPRKEGECIWL
jgi:hypothetical protein